MTIEEVGAQLEWHKAKTSRIELAQVGLTRRDLYKLMELYEADDQTREKLEALVVDGRERKWWSQYAETLNAQHQGFIALEDEAAHEHEYQPLVVPGLLQTSDYARAIISSGPFVVDDDDIDALVEVRLRRQNLLTQDDPIEFVGVITMAALYYEHGGKQALIDQLRKLADLTERPNVTLHVIPWGVSSGGFTGGLTLLHFPEATDPSIAFTDTVTSTQMRDSTREVRRYNRFFEHLRKVSLSPAETREIISTRMDDLNG